MTRLMVCTVFVRQGSQVFLQRRTQSDKEGNIRIGGIEEVRNRYVPGRGGASFGGGGGGPVQAGAGPAPRERRRRRGQLDEAGGGEAADVEQGRERGLTQQPGQFLRGVPAVGAVEQPPLPARGGGGRGARADRYDGEESTAAHGWSRSSSARRRAVACWSAPALIGRTTPIQWAVPGVKEVDSGGSGRAKNAASRRAARWHISSSLCVNQPSLTRY